MATARKLPSGSWRCLVYDYTDQNGKRKYKSFTAPTKKAAELAAAQYCASEKSSGSKSDLTIKEAIGRYIDAKEGVLSPSTIRGYRQLQGKYYNDIGDLSVFKLTTEKLQRFISSVSDGRSAKTVSNIYGLLMSAVTMFRPDAVFRVSLPKRVKQKKTAPESDHVRALFDAADPEMKICIALAAYGSLRRGEICGLKYKDINGCMVSVHADMVEDADHNFVYKEIPKTSDSVRIVRIPQEVADLIGTGPADDFIIKHNPTSITHRFVTLRDRLGIDMRFHDLRHYFASIGAVIGIPSTYLSDFGGWGRSSRVMQETYQNVFEADKKRYQDMMSDYFSELMQHEMQHE